MTMKEKILARRLEAEKRNTVEVIYSDGSTGSITVDKLMEDEPVLLPLPDGISKIMTKKYATNYASRVLAELMQTAPAFGLTKLHGDDVINLNDVLEIIGIDKINTVDVDGVFVIVSANDLNKALVETNKVKHILQDVINDMTNDQFGVGFTKVGYNYVPFYQLPIAPLDCVLKNGGLEIEVTINPRDLADLDEDLFNKKVCSLKRAIENAVCSELLDQE